MAVNMTMVILPCAASAETALGPVNRVSVPVEDYNINTPDENIFRISGRSDEFIMLDSSDSDVFVLCKQSYGKRPYSSANKQKFDPNDDTNVAYYLNNDFLGESSPLPSEIIKYVEFDHVWQTEAGLASADCPQDYEVKCGISLLSQTEWLKYYKRFGLKDDIQPDGWWLRTGRGLSGSYYDVMVSCLSGSLIGQTFGQKSSISSSYSIRPAFYLKKDFFKSVKLDYVGSSVAEMIGDSFSEKDFEGLGYTDSELRKIGVSVAERITIDGKMPKTFSQPLNAVSGTTDKSSSIKYTLLSGEEKTVFSDGAFTLDTGGKPIVKIEATDAEKIVLQLSDDISENSDFSAGAWSVSSGNLLSGGTMQMSGGDYIYSAFSPKSDKSYELCADISVKNKKNKGGFFAEYAQLDVNGNFLGGFSPLISVENCSGKYTANIPGLSDKCEFLILRARMADGAEGSISGFEINPVENSVKIKNDWAPTYIIDPDDGEFAVSIRLDCNIPKKYVVRSELKYLKDGEAAVKTQEIAARPGAEKSYDIKLGKLKKGNAELKIDVMLYGKVQASFKTEVCVMRFNERQKLDVYRRAGFCAHITQVTDKDGYILEAARKVGLKEVRSDLQWSRIEKVKGSYDFSATDYMIDKIGANDMDMLAILDYANVLYTNEEKSGIKTEEQLEGYLNYVRAVLKHYPQIKAVEIWNEPNGPRYWSTGVNYYEYINLVKAASDLIRSINPDIYIIGGSIDCSKNGIGFMNDLMASGLKDYVDAISFHPYYHHSRNDDAYQRRLSGYIEVKENYGGFTELVPTEEGWPIFENKDLEIVQDQEVIKTLVNSDYRYMSYGHIFNFKDINETFGMLRSDYSARPSCAAYAEFVNLLSGAEFAAKTDRYGEEVLSFVYMKNLQPVTVLWCPKGEKQIKLSSSETAYDIYGNKIDGRDFVLNDAPVYITGSGKEYLADVLKSEIELQKKDFAEKYPDISLPNEILDDKSAQQELRAHYEFMRSLIAQKSGDINSLVLEKLDKIGERLSQYAALYMSGGESINKNKLTNCDMTVSRLMARKAERNAELAERLKSAGAQGGLVGSKIIASNGLLSCAEELSKYEKPNKREIHFNVQPVNSNAFSNEVTSFNSIIFNTGKKSVKGDFTVYDENGDIVQSEKGIEIKPGESAKVASSIKMKKDVSGEVDYKMIFSAADGAYEQKLPFNILPAADITLKESAVAFSQISKVTATVKNNTGETRSFKLSVEAPEGWTLGESEKKLTLSGGEQREVDFEVSQKTKTDFNEYLFKMKLDSEDGREIKAKASYLDFTAVVHAKSQMNMESYTPDDWKDAYPTYINYPEDASAETLEKSEIAGKVYMKWDENYYYIYTDVHDLHHNAPYHGPVIYNGDSIQLSFDTLLTRSGKYDADDYEYGFALTNTGVESYAWQAPPDRGTGDKPKSWASITHDEEKNNTKYLIKIPKSDVAPLSLRAGYTFGFNLGINNAGMLGNRDDLVEITPGILYTKNTAAYRTWTLIK